MVLEHGFKAVESPPPGHAYDDAVGQFMQDWGHDLFDEVRFDGEDDNIACRGDLGGVV